MDSAEVGELKVDHKPGMLDGNAVEGKGGVLFGPQAANRVEVVFRFGEQSDVGAEENGFDRDVVISLLKAAQGLEAEPLEDIQAGEKVTSDPVGDQIIEFVFQRGPVTGRNVGTAEDAAGSGCRSQKIHIIPP